jgi:hypothetical protein
MNKSILLLLLLIFTLILSYAFSAGIIRQTTLNKLSGCSCHSTNSDSSVHVWIEGPDRLFPGETGAYKLLLTGGPAVAGGFNVAVRFGTLNPGDLNSKVLENQLTHKFPLSFTNDTVFWKFNFTATDTLGTDTIYSIAQSVNLDGINSDLDRWNFGNNFVVTVDTTIPVELISFLSEINNNDVILSWVTSSEINNKGFEIYRKERIAAEWHSLGFVEGKGTSVKRNEYFFVDKNLTYGSYQYRLKQYDYNGSFVYSNVIESSILPMRFKLEQNFPNPFNPSTEIKFTLSSESKVKLILYNAIGEALRILTDEIYAAGSHSVKLNGENLTAGVYFYSLQVDNKQGNFIDSKKMILLK